MTKTLLAICTLLALASASFATPMSNASLKGPYSFQLASPHQGYWNVNFICYDNSNNPYNVNFGGNSVSTDSAVGVITFDGKGHATGTFTEYGKFDQAASAATVVTGCNGAGSSGHAVYDAPFTGTFTGTYSVQANGTGALTIAISGGDTSGMILQIGGTAAIRTTVFMTGIDSSTSNKVDVTGMAVLQ